jgi:hypothetical protein
VPELDGEDPIDFDAGNAGRLEIVPISLSVETTGASGGNTRVFIGVGLDGIWVREKINGLPEANGASIGAHLHARPEFRLRGPFTLVTEARLQFANVTLRSGRNRYEFDLNGVSLMAGLGYRF